MHPLTTPRTYLHRNTQHGWRSLALCLLLLTGMVACSDQNGSSTVGKVSQREVTFQQILGFEDLEGWTGEAGGLSDNRTEGQWAMPVSAAANVESVSLPTLGVVADAATLDVWVPEDVVNAGFYVTLVLKIPSQQLWYEELPRFDMQGTAGQDWHRLEFPLSPTLQGLLQSSYDDLTVTVVTNLPQAQTGQYLVDRLDFFATPDSGTGGVGGTGGGPVGGAGGDSGGSGGVGTGGTGGAPTGGTGGATTGGTGGMATDGSDPTGGSSGSGNEPPTTYEFVAWLPEGMAVSDPTLVASERVSVHSGDTVTEPGGGYGVIVHTGAPTDTYTNVGSQAQVGDVWSVAPVVVRSQATVHGQVRTYGSITKSDSTATVLGDEWANAPFALYEAARWSVTFRWDEYDVPSRIIQSPDQEPSPAPLSPGRYGFLGLDPGAVVTMSPGTYVITALQLEPGSQLVADTSTGPVIIYVHSSLLYRGAIVTNDPSHLLLGYAGGDAFGVGRLDIEAPFKGTLVAPDADVVLASLDGEDIHEGAFFTKKVTTHQWTEITHRPFDCEGAPDSGLCPRVLPELGQPCDADSDCAAPLVCGSENGSAFGLDPGESVCWRAYCDFNPELDCGSVSAGCGLCIAKQLSVCTMQCDGAVCGSNQPDNCGGTCQSCGVGEPGCASDAECPDGLVCGQDIGSHFGYDPSDDVCWPVACNYSDLAQANCGAPGSDPTDYACGLCLCEPDCDGKSCGSDGCGDVCGTCGSGTYCDEPSGSCHDVLPLSDELPDDVSPDEVVTQGVGHTQGQFEVTADGRATYRIDLDTPPGRGGHQPRLALVYDSGTHGAPTLAPGWSLDLGYPGIHRCERSIARDGRTSTPRFDASDRFCIGGYPLIAVDGDYGEDGTQYRTPFDAGVRIVSYSDYPAYGPESFVLHDGIGGEVEYAQYISHNVGGGIFSRKNAWRPTYERDAAGNEIKYGWAGLSIWSGGGHAEVRSPRIKGISYNDAAGRLQDTYISFDHSLRPDPRSRHYMGTRVQNYHQLDRISVKVTGQLVMEYRLVYETRENNTLVLSEFQECAPELPDGSGEIACKAPTRFQYAYPSGDVSRDNTIAVDLPGPLHPPTFLAQGEALDSLVGDFDGDGKDDLIVSSYDKSSQSAEQTSRILFSGRQPSGELGVTSRYLADSQFFPYTVVDWDGDGDDDILFRDIVAPGTFKLIDVKDDRSIEVTALDLAYPWSGEYGRIFYTFAMAMDADGNGVRDLVTCDWVKEGSQWVSNWELTRLPRSHFAAGPEVLSIGAKCSTHLALDVDGDGSEELLVAAEDETLALVDFKFDSTGQFDDVEAAPTSVPVDSLPVDVNGDGLSDFVEFRGDRFWVYMNEGAGVRGRDFVRAHRVMHLSDLFDETFGEGFSETHDIRVNAWMPFDMNGDGLGDLVALGWGSGDRSLVVLESRVHGDAWVGDYGEFGGFELVQTELPNQVGQTRGLGLDYDGDGDLDLALDSAGTLSIYRGQSHGELLARVEEGGGRALSVLYASSATAHTPQDADEACYYPVLCPQGFPGRLVRKVDEFGGQFDSAAPLHEWRYSYEGARIALEGPGRLGFTEQVIEEVVGSPRVIVREFEPTLYVVESGTYPFAGLEQRRTETIELGDDSRVTRTVENGPALFRVEGVPGLVSPYFSGGDEEVREEAGGEELTTYKRSSSFVPDAYGNMVEATEILGEGQASVTKTTTMQYENDQEFEERWLVRLPYEITVVGEGDPEFGAQSRTTRFSFDSASGLLETTVTQPETPDELKESVVARDQFGNPTSVQHEGLVRGELQARQTTFEYDDRGVFVAAIVDPESYRTEYSRRPATGLLSRLYLRGRAGGGRTLEWAYVSDGFGRERYSESPAGDRVRTAYSAVLEGGLVVSRSSSTAPNETLTLDPFMRVTARTLGAYLGDSVSQSLTLDSEGRALTVGLLRKSPSPSSNLSYERDELGRPVVIHNPNGSQTQLCYLGRATCALGPTQRVACELTDEAGRMSFASDPVDDTDASRGCEYYLEEALSGGLQGTSYAYGPFNDVVRTEHASSGLVVSTPRDALGRVRQRSETGLPLVTIAFNAFGEVDSVTEEGVGVSSFERDKLGRILRRTDPTDDQPAVEWVYRSDLQEVPLSVAAATGVTVSFDYDDDGQLVSTAKQVGSDVLRVLVSERDGSLPTAMRYEASGDAIGRLDLRLSRDTSGNLIGVTEENGTSYWSVTSTNSFGTPAAAELGNGLTSTLTANAEEAWIESIAVADPSGDSRYMRGYEYYTDGRLRTIVTDAGASILEYSARNELTSIDGPDGTHGYGYQPSGALERRDAITFEFGDPSHPFLPDRAVRDDGAEAELVWDGRGRLQHRTGTLWPEYHATYNHTGQVVSVWGEDESAATLIAHDAFGTAVETTTPTERALQFGTDMIRTETGTGDALFEFRIPGLRGPAAVVKRTSAGGSSSEEVFFVHADLRGSVEVVTDINGDVVATQVFTPYGELEAGGVDLRLVGFAGHSAADAFGLVDMGLRSYDVFSGRFVAPDYFGSDVGFNMSPHAYAFNDPYGLTDPLGLQPAAIGCLGLGATAGPWAVAGIAIVSWYANRSGFASPMVGPSILPAFSQHQFGSVGVAEDWGPTVPLDIVNRRGKPTEIRGRSLERVIKRAARNAAREYGTERELGGFIVREGNRYVAKTLGRGPECRGKACWFDPVAVLPTKGDIVAYWHLHPTRADAGNPSDPQRSDPQFSDQDVVSWEHGYQDTRFDYYLVAPISASSKGRAGLYLMTYDLETRPPPSDLEITDLIPSDQKRVGRIRGVYR